MSRVGKKIYLQPCICFLPYAAAAPRVRTMLFCPNCANVVTVSQSLSTGENTWACPTCPFHFPMDRQVTSRMRLERKQVDDVMGGEDSWKNVDSTDGVFELECASYSRSDVS